MSIILLGVSSSGRTQTIRPFITDRLVDPDYSELYNNRWIAPMVGMSKGFGEMAGFSIVYSGLTMYVGFGKDWILCGENSSKLLWHTGLGFTTSFYGEQFDPHSSVMLGIDFSQNSHYKHHSLTLDCRYFRWIGYERRWGIYGGTGIGIADFTNSNAHIKFAWNLELGIAYRIPLRNEYKNEFFNNLREYGY